MRRNTDWKGSSRSWKKSKRRMNFCSRSKIESMQECVETGVVLCQPIVQRPHTRLVWRSQDKKRVGNTDNCNQVQQSSPKQQQLGQDVDATLLASGSAEKSGINSLLLSTLSSLSSMEAHATKPNWAMLDLTPRVWARCRSGTGSRSAPETDPLTSREGLGGV